MTKLLFKTNNNLIVTSFKILYIVQSTHVLHTWGNLQFVVNVRLPEYKEMETDFIECNEVPRALLFIHVIDLFIGTIDCVNYRSALRACFSDWRRYLGFGNPSYQLLSCTFVKPIIDARRLKGISLFNSSRCDGSRCRTSIHVYLKILTSLLFSLF